MAHAIVCYLYLVTLIVCSVCDSTKNKPPLAKSKELNHATLPPCELCSVLVNSFKKGLEITAKSNFQGGDTAWEEEKLGDYASSEVRFIEIQESLCSDVERGSNQCHSLAEEVENMLEEWWFNQRQRPDLFEWLCITTLKYCCQQNHYGPNCLPCPGYPLSVCSGNGKCRGAGIREGTGTCDCDSGYQGDLCDICAPGYYESYRDESKMLCSKCHVACHDNCTQAGPWGCLACNSGWSYHSDRGCIDINECVLENSPCLRNEFCVNNEGSYSCLACDKSCDGCQGDGPDMCDKCARGYMLKDGLCVGDETEWSKGWDTRRYLTYLGLCIATCIIFQKNPAVASLIGLCVAIYVTVSEYMLGAGSSNDSPLIKF